MPGERGIGSGMCVNPFVCMCVSDLLTKDRVNALLIHCHTIYLKRQHLFSFNFLYWLILTVYYNTCCLILLRGVEGDKYYERHLKSANMIKDRENSKSILKIES